MNSTHGYPLWRLRKLTISMMSLFYILLSIILISCPSVASEPMIAQAIMMTNSQYGISRRLGTVLFTQNEYDGPVRITGELTFDKVVNAHVGMHVHAFGNMTHGCESTGPHFNPNGQKHGAPSDEVRHAGDLGNIKIVNTKCQIDITDTKIQLSGPHSILGPLVIHMNTDDLGKGENDESRTTGNVGRPQGCGIIGVATDFSILPEKTATPSPIKAADTNRSVSMLITMGLVIALLRNFRTTTNC